MSDNLQLQTESIHSPVTSGGKMSTTRSKREKCHRHQKASQNWPVSLWDTAEVMFSPVEIATNWWNWKSMQKVKSHIVNHHLFLVTIFCANEIILKVPPTTSAANKMASYYQGQNIAWWDERSYCLTRTERFKWHHCTCCTCFTFQTLYCSMSRVFVYRKAEIGVLTNWRLAPLCCWKM